MASDIPNKFRYGFRCAEVTSDMPYATVLPLRCRISFGMAFICRISFEMAYAIISFGMAYDMPNKFRYGL
jgi:hypothetical protein